jgi:UDP-glucose 4-epimerase
MTWLITGGAGYIGSHIADMFLCDGKDVVIYDSLIHGHRSRVSYLEAKYSRKIPLIISDIRDVEAFKLCLDRYRPSGIVHAAALKSVAQSIEFPELYFEVNLNATSKILDLITASKIRSFIYSSTAAVYGSSEIHDRMSEADPKLPISPYGISKLLAEGLVEKFLQIDGNHGTSLRFFNVIGTAAPELQDLSLENLVSIVIEKIKKDESPAIFGSDYETEDGTCVRDFVDVRDIARAHLAVANFEKPLPFAINVGTGKGSSVRNVIEAILKAAGRENLSILKLNRRKGDPDYSVADVKVARHALGFEAHYSMIDSISSLFLTNTKPQSIRF